MLKIVKKGREMKTKKDRRLRKIKVKGIKNLNKELSCTRGTQAQNAEEKV